MSNILVTGGTGMIGRYLVDQLVERGHQVKVASLDGKELCNKKAIFKRLDLRNFNNCLEVCNDIDEVYHLAGVKGSPKMCREKPADFFVPTLTFNVNMMEAARRCKVKKYLYTSSIGVYAPAEVFNEDDVKFTFPSENDKFAGWAKRMGEMQAESYVKQYPGECTYCIVRPGNVYGRFDNFDSSTGMVIPSLISRLFAGENPLRVWGSGNEIRDFIHASDVASSMIFIMDNGITSPVNVSNGLPVSISDLVAMIMDHFPNATSVFTNQGDRGDNKRIMNTKLINSFGWKPSISLKKGLADTIEWYKKEGYKGYQRYNSFKEKK